MDELIVVHTNSALWDSSVMGFAVFAFGMIAVLVRTAQVKKNPEHAFLTGLGWAAVAGAVIFLVSLFLNHTVIDPVMQLALSQDRVTFVYRSGAEVAFERGQAKSVREYTAVKSGIRKIAITAQSGREIHLTIPSRKQRQVAEAIAARLGLQPSGTDGLWVAREP